MKRKVTSIGTKFRWSPIRFWGLWEVETVILDKWEAYTCYKLLDQGRASLRCTRLVSNYKASEIDMKFRYVFRKPEFKEVEGVGTVVESINEKWGYSCLYERESGEFLWIFSQSNLRLKLQNLEREWRLAFEWIFLGSLRNNLRRSGGAAVSIFLRMVLWKRNEYDIAPYSLVCNALSPPLGLPRWKR